MTRLKMKIINKHIDEKYEVNQVKNYDDKYYINYNGKYDKIYVEIYENS